MTEPDHQQFLERLDRSRPAVHAVADWLRWNGRAATVPETRYAPSFDVHKEYADNGDIFLSNGRLVEVKHLTINFTSAADWPFREFFIDSQARVARLGDNVDAYIALSADYAAMGMVLPKTREHWYFTETRNGNTGKVVHNVACSLEHVIFRPFEKRFAHYCHCSKLGVFGVGGKWFCREHHPHSSFSGTPAIS